MWRRVPRLAGVDVAGERAAQEREVSDEVQDLVPHELVAEAQGPGDDAAVVEDDRVVEAASPRASPRARIASTSRAKPNVRAGAIRAEYSSGRIGNVSSCRPTIGCGKSIS